MPGRTSTDWGLLSSQLPGENEKGIPTETDGEGAKPPQTQHQPQCLPEQVHPSCPERGVSAGWAAPGAEKTPKAVYCDFEEDDRFGPKHSQMFKILKKKTKKPTN